MKCESCDTPATPEQLAKGRCLACVAKENTIFRLLLSHTVMAIENGSPVPHPAFGVCYTQEFGEAFVNHLKEALRGVKPLSVPPAVNPHQTQSPKCKCGAHMTLHWPWDDDQVTDHAFNVYGCDYCGMILKVMVTDNDRETWIKMED